MLTFTLRRPSLWLSPGLDFDLCQFRHVKIGQFLLEHLCGLLLVLNLELNLTDTTRSHPHRV